MRSGARPDERDIAIRREWMWMFTGIPRLQRLALNRFLILFREVE